MIRDKPPIVLSGSTLAILPSFVKMVKQTQNKGILSIGNEALSQMTGWMRNITGVSMLIQWGRSCSVPIKVHS